LVEGSACVAAKKTPIRGQGSHYRVPAIVTITRQKQLGPQMRGPWS